MRSELLFISIVCLLIFIEENDSLRLRLPGLKISATFSKTAAYIKRKLRLNTNKTSISDQSEIFEDDSKEENDEL